VSGEVKQPTKWEKGWSSGLPETPCGSGSKIKRTAKQRFWIAGVTRRYSIETIGDIGAGDLNWISLVDLNGAQYTAYDLVKRAPSVLPIDIIRDVPPRHDLIMCLWVLNHLKKDDAARAFANIKASGSKYLMVTGQRRLEVHSPECLNSLAHVERLKLTHIRGGYMKLVEL